jgi:amino acid permease
MDKKFSEQEKKYLKSVTKWNERTSKQQVFFYNICMIVGAVIVLFTCLYIIQNVDQENIYLKGLPGFILSIPFFLIYYFGLKAIDEKNLIASIFEKLRRHDSK